MLEDIAIIAQSCVLPRAFTPEKFWENVRNKKTTFQKISNARFKEHLFHQNENTILKTTSQLASEILPEELESYISSTKLPKSKLSRLSLYTEIATDKLFQEIRSTSKGKVQDIIIGSMNPDDILELLLTQEKEKSLQEELGSCLSSPIEKEELQRLVEKIGIKNNNKDVSDKDHFYTMSILARIAKEHNLKGEVFLVDSACASSLAAIDLSVQRLRLGLSDLAITGGLESNLSPATFVIFSSVGALAPEISKPFCSKSQGLIQSEGAVFFALKRLSDAQRDGDKIHALIKSISGGSDGRQASLFQPNQDGQKRAYQQVYGNKKPEIDYLEAHGTGTEIGDFTESQSINDYFRNLKLPVGSVKSLVGHTKGAAGATGMLKALGIIKNKMIPASIPTETSLFEDLPNTPFVNFEEIDISDKECIRVGVSAFGFGGTNYHLLLSEYKKENPNNLSSKFEEQKLVVLSEDIFPLDGFNREDFFKYDCPVKLPPNSVNGIDKVQLASIISTHRAINTLSSTWNFVPKNKINVVSACTLGLDQIFEIADLLIYEAIIRLGEMKFSHYKSVKKMRNYMDTVISKKYAPVNEDAATGVLNNVIAGRVCNLFDFHGKSYNIDKDIGSENAALSAIYGELQVNPEQVFILISVNETLEKDKWRPERRSIKTRVLTTASFAKDYEMNPLQEVTVEL